MEKIDFWKKYPSILIGEPILNGFFPAELSLSLVNIENISKLKIENLLFFLNVKDDEIQTTLKTLKMVGACDSQIIILTDQFLEWTQGSLQKFKCLSLFKNESAEEFRLRIIQIAELKKQKILGRELATFADSGDDPSGQQRAMDRSRLAHSLCMALSLESAEHLKCIRLAFRYEKENSCTAERDRWDKQILQEPWPSEYPLINILADICELALRNPQSIHFRTGYRLASCNLTFKVRTDLKNAVEACFQHIWEEQQNAA